DEHQNREYYAHRAKLAQIAFELDRDSRTFGDVDRTGDVPVLTVCELDVHAELAVGVGQRGLELRLADGSVVERLAAEVRNLLAVHPDVGLDRVDVALGGAIIDDDRCAGTLLLAAGVVCDEAEGERKRDRRDAASEQVVLRHGWVLARRRNSRSPAF